MALPAVSPRDFTPLLGGTDYGEIVLEESEASSIRLEDSKIEDSAYSFERGMGLRFLRRRGAAIETLQGSAHSLEPREAARLRKGLLDVPPGPETQTTLTAHQSPVRQPPEKIAFKEKIGLLKDLDRAVRAEFPHIRQVSIGYAERNKETVLLNSEEAFRRERRVSVLLHVNVVAEKDSMLQTGNAILGGLKGYELLSDYSPLAAAREAARRAILKLEAPKAKAGETTVVLSNSAGGTFIHEAIGHSLEADHVQEGSSPAYKDMIGKTVAPETITVIDDPTLPFYRGSFRYDDEGVEARPTPVVKNGVLTDYLYDRVTAMKEGKSSNGHGRRESFHSRPIPRMSNLYIAPGPDDPARIIKDLKAGILVTRMGGGQVNTATGEFVFEVDEGFWVEDGVIRHMVRDANLLGVGPEVLRSIDRVGWDIGWGIGTCGKDGQGVPVGDGQPTLRLPRILIGGKHE